MREDKEVTFVSRRRTLSFSRGAWPRTLQPRIRHDAPLLTHALRCTRASTRNSRLRRRRLGAASSGRLTINQTQWTQPKAGASVRGALLHAGRYAK